MLILNNSCSCGGKIAVFLYEESDNHGFKQKYIDYGVCLYCGKVYTLPPENIKNVNYVVYDKEYLV
jgi:hypothetical protein